MANAARRLKKEHLKLLKEPLPGIELHPHPENILEWHYMLLPSEAPYRGGCYVGKLLFPQEYPLKPPGVLMLTPSGRFEVNQRICTSFSDYHPESWDPAWTAGTVAMGLQSFMYEQ